MLRRMENTVGYMVRCSNARGASNIAAHGENPRGA
jgi:hypothetical protein